MGIELVEMSDWNCCGASSAHSTSRSLAHALTGRNLAIAEKQAMPMAAICPACFVRMRETCLQVKNGSLSKDEISSLIDKPYTASFDVRHILDIVTAETEAVKKLVVKPLKGLRAAAYYGCYLVRPRELTGFDDTENPVSMDNLLESLGADAADWGGKVDCCGGSGSFTDRSMVKELAGKISDSAREVHADVIVSACGLCQANLETRQSGKNALPVVYFTELMGLAFGLDARKWFKKHIINPIPVFKKRGLL
jgi:heterodisulfide reductase subunit B